MSLWGTKKPDDVQEQQQQQNGEGETHTESRRDFESSHSRRDFDSSHSRRGFEDESRMREPTERDRLLPSDNRRPPHADGYLDPDDPAVSPYNLWTVRFMRYLTVLFLVLTFLWWVLLLVSIFVSPPGLHTRGSGFSDFSYTTLAAGILLNSLLFFSGPSLAMRVTQGVLGFVLLINLIMIVSVTRLRAEEGAPGIASIVWVTLMAAWCISTDRVVAWAKREEEERLTGRPETRRTLQQWLSVFASTTILVIFVLITILMTATLILRSLDAGLPYDGDRVRIDDGKYDVHFACVGNKTTDKHGKTTPTILLESAEDPVEYDFEHWAYAAYKNGTIDRYCYWDRPGYAWSDNAPSPHSAGMSADNLAEVLAIQGEEGPWILVSAGYGSIVSRIFSARNFREVVGIMMIDPLHEDFLAQLASPILGFQIWGWGVISPLGIQRIIGAIFGGQTRDDRVYGKAAFAGGKFIKAKLQENLVANSFSRQEISSARTIQAEDTPLVVISSGIHVRKDDTWAKKQRDLTNITGKLLAWDVVNKAPHYVWHNQDGRDIMEKRLGEIVKEHYKPRKDHPKLESTMVDHFRAQRNEL